MIPWSPCVPQRACITPPCAGLVAMPVEGPERWTFTTTQGISPIAAMPRFSCISENPGPLVAVKAFLPAADAPMIAAMLESSSSIWIYTPPTSGILRAAASATSEEGVIGYPA
mgnify:FL=1